MLVGPEGRGCGPLGGSSAGGLFIPHAKGLANLEPHRTGDGPSVPDEFSMGFVHTRLTGQGRPRPLAGKELQLGAEDTALMPWQFQWDSVLKESICSRHLKGRRLGITRHKKGTIFMTLIPGQDRNNGKHNKTQRKI